MNEDLKAKLTRSELIIARLTRSESMQAAVVEGLVRGQIEYGPFNLEEPETRDLLMEAMEELRDAFVYVSMLVSTRTYAQFKNNEALLDPLTTSVLEQALAVIESQWIRLDALRRSRLIHVLEEK